MKETIAFICLVLAGGLTIGYFVMRPLVAIGDIPSKIEKLIESIDHLSEIIKNKEK